LTLAITSSGVDKGALTAGQIMQIDAAGNTVNGSNQSRQPSAEAALHLAIVKARGVNAVAHTHSVWNTIVSTAYGEAAGIVIEGYEMLKGLAGVHTHTHCEWLPILGNAQEYGALVDSVEETLRKRPGAHGFLLQRHGLYTWGKDLAEAKRHVEILEFLMEIIGRTCCGAGRG
jgi:methylthioribulose-1-phosphate dehydratase